MLDLMKENEWLTKPPKMLGGYEPYPKCKHFINRNRTKAVNGTARKKIASLKSFAQCITRDGSNSIQSLLLTVGK